MKTNIFQKHMEEQSDLHKNQKNTYRNYFYQSNKKTNTKI